MKGLSWFNKMAFVLNTVLAFLLLIACAAPYITSENLAFLSFLSLAVPFLVVSNLLFLVYWLIQKKRQLWLSLFTLIFSYFVLGTFVQFNSSEEDSSEEDLKVMSYNVRNFDKNEYLDNPRVFEDVKSLVDKEGPDIICFQEVGYLRRKEYTKYPYIFLKYINNQNKVLLGIFSKYPIIKSELIYFPNSSNVGSYADILYKNDTIRVYNVHLQSLRIIPSEVLSEEPSDKLFKRLEKSFKKQQEQAKIIAKHYNSTRHKKIICGDFNSTQYSNVYHTIKGDMQDSFIAKGSGFGKTYDFLGAPLRIDFILADKAFEVKSHKNYDEKLSDHYPVMASFAIKSE